MKKKTIILFIIITPALILLFFSAIFYSKQRHKETVTLTAVYEYAQICGIMDVIKEQGYLEKYLPDYVEVEWVMIDSGSERRDALATKRASIAVIENTSIAFAN